MRKSLTIKKNRFTVIIVAVAGILITATVGAFLIDAFYKKLLSDV